MEILEEIIRAIPVVLQGLGGLVVFATAIAKLTPTPKDDEVVSKARKILNRLIEVSPTLGKNPHKK